MELTKRETEQNESTVAYFAEAIANDADIDPIVTIDDEILDGHHRYEAAIATGAALNVTSITRSQYEALTGRFADMEIAAAAHIASGNYEAAYNIANQFGFSVELAESAAAELAN